MATQTIPTYDQDIRQGNKTSSVWYRFFQGLFNGTPPGIEATVTLGATPYTYTAPSGGFLLVRGGTVTAIQLTRSLTTLTGLTSGLFPLSQGDQLTITYTVLPTVIFYPQ